jgi:HTH-type transcriptional regulator / antitoxin HipB
MADPAQDFGQQIRDRRRDLRLGQEDLSDLSGVSVRFIRDLEHGKSSVRLDKLLAVLEALGLVLRAQIRQP